MRSKNDQSWQSVLHHICETDEFRWEILDIRKVSYCWFLHKVKKLIWRVIDGADSTLDQMERVPVNPKNRPLEEIKMTSVSHYHCGVRVHADDRLRYTPTQLRTGRSRCLDHIPALHLYLCTIVVQSNHFTHYTTIWTYPLIIHYLFFYSSNYTTLPLLVLLHLTVRNLDGGWRVSWS